MTGSTYAKAKTRLGARPWSKSVFNSNLTCWPIFDVLTIFAPGSANILHSCLSFHDELLSCWLSNWKKILKRFYLFFINKTIYEKWKHSTVARWKLYKVQSGWGIEKLNNQSHLDVLYFSIPSCHICSSIIMHAADLVNYIHMHSYL